MGGMKITTKEVQSTVGMLNAIIEEYKETTPKRKRDWRTYEQRLSLRLRTAIRELEPLIEEAISTLNIMKVEKRGRKPKLTLKQKTLLLLLKRLIGKSNREMSDMLVVFSLLSEIDVSYKTVERLYSDDDSPEAIRKIADEWIAANQTAFDGWIAEAAKESG